MEFIRVYPNAAPIVGDILARNMDWPGAMEISERLKQMLPPQLQGQDPQAVAAQQQIQQLVQALEQMQKQLADKSQENAIDARKLDIDAFNAETNRIKAMGGALTPEAVQALVVDTLRLVLGSPDVLPAPTAQPDLGPQPDAHQVPAGVPDVVPGAITDNAAAGSTAG
jgi:hypothetical protein